ncbi:cytochrome b [Aureimonas sp. AU20]|uniref:cytochrome b n=1 Tax=Aureimonas sp. AU20 TaxID=1349819 RepID=UPI00071F9DDC|nr:cytochrome b/b6 domain-containing protein [Aureimonas sp. AU20]ALN75022.1 hypothetical protein M673_20040 [Aureimonas sp. AU20]
MLHNREPTAIRYPSSIRVLHWTRAVLILGLLACGWFMTGREEGDAVAAFLYPNHKQFGVLVWLLALVHLTLRWRMRSTLPQEPHGLKPWERFLSATVQRLMIALTIATPFFGYAMSSSFSQSDGVPFFFVSHIPEIIPKSDRLFEIFTALHMYSAYLLLACVLLHVSGAVLHRLQDKGGETDVLARML